MRLAITLLVLCASLNAWQSPKKPKKSAVPADTSTDSQLTLPVLQISVEGNDQIPSATILQAAGIKVGDIASKEGFEAARQRLLDTGMFEGVGYEYKPVAGDHPGYAAKFMVTEIKPLYKVQFAGLPAKREELNSYLKTRDPMYSGLAPPARPVIDRWASFLGEWTASRGAQKKIIGKIILVGPNEYAVLFRPDEPLQAVARVNFTGNEVFDMMTLQNSIGSVAYGLPFTEENFRELLDNQLRPMYEAKGYMRVKFEDLSSAPVPPPVKGLLVNVKIVEGSIYKLGKVTMTGVAGDDRDNLLHVATLKSGQTVNFDVINQALEKVRKAMKQSGYLHSTADLERKIDDKTKKVDVTFVVDRGELYEFGEMTIKGLDIEGENAIRKLWSKKPGDPYSPEYPDYFLAQVKEEGIFDYLGPTHVDVKMDEATHTATVTLVFTPAEKKPDQEKKKGGFGPY